MDRTDMNDKPDAELITRLRECKLLDKDGKETTFGDVIDGRRVVTIFIRHWFCIACQNFNKHLAASIPPSNLPESTSIVIIGCGGHQPIDPFYYDKTGLCREYKLYADPTRTIHDKDHLNFHLGMPGNKEGEKTDYEQKLGGYWTGASKSWKMAFKDPSLVPYTGSPMRNGGEFIFEADGTCSFAHRMRNAGDHTQIKDLAKVIGAKYTPLPDE